MVHRFVLSHIIVNIFHRLKGVWISQNKNGHIIELLIGNHPRARK